MVRIEVLVGSPNEDGAMVEKREEVKFAAGILQRWRRAGLPIERNGEEDLNYELNGLERRRRGTGVEGCPKTRLEWIERTRVFHVDFTEIPLLSLYMAGYYNQT